jgi:hypothetical protein
MTRSVIFVALALALALAACGQPREISITRSRLESDPDRYRDWIVRVHLRGQVEFVVLDSTGAGSTMLLQRSDFEHPVVSCAISPGLAGGMPSGAAVYGGGLGFGASFGTGMPGKWVPIHRENQVLLIERAEFLGDTLVARVPLPRAEGHRYFVRVPGLEDMIEEPCDCIHPGYRQMDGEFVARIPEDLIYRFSGLSPASAPDGAGVVSRRRTGGLLGSGLGLGPLRTEPLRGAPTDALRFAADGQDSTAVDLIEAAIFDAARGEFWPHDELYDHFLAAVLIHVARGDLDGARDAAGHLMHFADIRFGPADLDFEPDPDSALAEFLAARDAELERAWPRFLDQIGVSATDGSVRRP